MWAASLAAQTTQGVISGRLLDSVTGQPIGGASVEYSSSASGATSSSRDGYYSLPLLSPGIYRVRATVAGFQSQELEELELPVAGLIELDFKLRPLSDVWEAGEYRSVFLPGSKTVVTFFGPDVDASRTGSFDPQKGRVYRLDTSISGVVSNRQIQDLPLTGRDVYNSLVLEPGVNADTTTARGIGVSENGQRPSASNFLLDGVENNNYLVSGPLTIVAPEAVEEYRVSTSGFSAEYGRTGGYVANVATKAGTSEWHGVAYFDFGNDVLDANDFSRNSVGLGRAPLRYIQPGVQLGGPILRSRLYVSTAIDDARNHTAGDPVSFYVPSTQFMTLLANDSQLFPPASQARQLLLAHPPPAVSSPTGDDVALLTAAPPLPVDQFVFLERADYIARGGGDHWTARVIGSRVSRPDFVWSPYPGFSSTFQQNSTSVALGDVSTIRPSLVNEARGAVSDNLIAFNRPHPEIPTVVTQPDNAAGLVFLPGSPAAYGYRNHTRNLELLDNLSWFRGRHQFKFGGGALVRSIGTDLGFASAGEFEFPSFTFFEADLFSSAVPQSVVAGVSRQQLAAGSLAIPPSARQYRDTQFDLFAQDSFRITDRLSLNYGVRYENFGVPKNVGPVKDAMVSLGPGGNLASASVMYPQAGDEPIYSADRNNWGVRAGLAYSPFHGDRTVLRLGYGIFYDRLFDNLWENVNNNNTELVSFSPNGTVPYLQALSHVIPTLPGLQIDQTLSRLTMFQSGLRTPYVHSFLAGVQQQVARNFIVEVNGVGSLGRDLIDTDIVNRDFSVPGIMSAMQSRLQPALQEIYDHTNQGSSDYLAMTALARYNRGTTQFQIAYAWSHSIDNQSEPLNGEYFNFEFFSLSTPAVAPPISAFSQQFNPNADRGSSDFDQRQTLTFSAIREFSSSHLLLRDWRIAAIGAIRSGLPYTVLVTSPESSPILNDRASLTTSASAAEINQPATGGRLLLSASAFTTAPGNQIGNTGRNAFTGPGFWNIDLSLARSFALTRLRESTRITVRADGFNFLNHANLGNPDSFLGSPDFGVATFGRQEVSTGAPTVFPLRETARQVQLLVRLTF